MAPKLRAVPARSVQLLLKHLRWLGGSYVCSYSTVRSSSRLSGVTWTRERYSNLRGRGGALAGASVGVQSGVFFLRSRPHNLVYRLPGRLRRSQSQIFDTEPT
jgi:hypothetical protein